MEKYVIISYTNTNDYSINEIFTVLGQVDLPEVLDKKNYIIHIKDKTKVITPLYDSYIYSSNVKVKFLLCEEYLGVQNAKLNSIANYYNAHVISEPKTKEYIISAFMDRLINNGIDFKSYFRKEKIEKILED